MWSFPARWMDTSARTPPRTDASFGITTRPTILRPSTEFLAVEAPSTGLAPPLLGAWFSSIPDTPSLDRCPATFFSRLGSTEFAWVVASVGEPCPKRLICSIAFEDLHVGHNTLG